jgi:exodeoxyribonuclease VII large subunit
MPTVGGRRSRDGRGPERARDFCKGANQVIGIVPQRAVPKPICVSIFNEVRQGCHRMSPRSYVLPGSRSTLVQEDAADGAIQSVSDLTRRIKDLLESTIAPGWVRGEVSNLRVQSSGHSYFSLKDAGAQIACVMFRGDSVRSGSAGVLRDGAQVIAFGSVSVYEPRGNYQLVVRTLVDDGVGRLQIEFERLKQRLAAEGLFEASRKKKLPSVPATIAFITSPTGAAVQDFIRILKRRRWSGRLIVLPAKVQGAGAALEMVAMLELAASLECPAPDGGKRPLLDAVVIGRGGGSLEDLWAFNEEPLVRAVAACPIPTISAVGHEIDFTLCDFAADVRAETPSAAAELVTSGYVQFVERVRRARVGLDDAATRVIGAWVDEIRVLAAKLAAASPQARLERAHLRLDDVNNRLGSVIRHRLGECRHRVLELSMRLQRLTPESEIVRTQERLTALARRLSREAAAGIEARCQRLASLAERLRALDPDSVLRRGFAIVRNEAGRPVVSCRQIASGDRLTAQFHDGVAPLKAE